MYKRTVPGRWWRRLAAVAATLAGLWLLLCAGFYWAMTQPPEVFGAIVAKIPMATMMVVPFPPMWKRARAGNLKPGDAAPDFTLPTLDHRETVRLSSFRGSRPVVLVFGSYT
jgi:hypothetical protein